MPQPLKPPLSLKLDPLNLSERPELAAQIGIIAAAWSRVEMLLGVMLGDLLGSYHHLGLTMFFALVSTPARIDTIAAVAIARGVRNPRGLEELLEKLRLRARERNRIVHSQ